MTSIEMIDPASIVIFGASGNLTHRKLVPALHSLACDGHLAPGTHVIGIGQRKMSNETFRLRLLEGIRHYARMKPNPKLCALWSRFEDRFEYVQMDTTDPADYDRLATRLRTSRVLSETSGNILFYLATPPAAAPSIVQGLKASGLADVKPGWQRIVVEKPFGEDLASARRLNHLLHGNFAESQVLRIDHFLGKETVQNILALRFANAIFEPLWNRNYIDHVQVTVAESIGVDERAGVLRDIIQNHLLQLLALIAMEPPASSSVRSLRDEKVKVFEAIRPVGEADIVFGQYAGYREEDGVALDSQTPTYAALRLFIDNWRWQGVPFLARSGKLLAEKTTEITLQFREVPLQLFPGAAPTPNYLSLRIQPNEGIHLQFEAKVPGAGMKTQPVDMVFRYAEHFEESALPDAYERLLLDAIAGDASLFIRDDEIEHSWAILDRVLHAEVTPAIYASSSWGPAEADALLGAEGRRWINECGKIGSEA